MLTRRRRRSPRRARSSPGGPRRDRPDRPTGWRRAQWVAAAAGADRPDAAVAPAAPGRHGVPGRGPESVGRAPAVGELAARHGHPAVPVLLLRCAGDLPAARRARRPRGRPGRGPGPVAGLHAGRDHPAVERGPAAVRAAGRVLRRRAVRRAGPHPAPGRVRHATTPCPCSSSRSRPGACCAPGTRARCWAAWSRRARPWPWPTPRPTPRSCSTCSCWCWRAGRVPGAGRPGRAAAGGHPAGHGDRVPGRGPADRRGQLPPAGSRGPSWPRLPTRTPRLSVLSSTWYWAGILVVLAVAGVIISAVRRQGRAQTWLLAVLTAAAILGPAEQAWLHTAALLNEHVGVGAWFAAIAAGYAADRFVAAAPRRAGAGAHQRDLRDRAGVPRLPGRGRSRGRSRPAGPTRPRSSRSSARWPRTGSGRLLVEDPSVAKYYLPSGREWRRWSSTRNIVLPSGASTGNAGRHGGHRRRGRRQDLRQLHRPGLLRLRGPQLHRHHRAGPRPGHRAAPQPGLPHHLGRPLRHRGQAGRPGHLCDLEIRAAAGLGVRPGRLVRG